MRVIRAVVNRLRTYRCHDGALHENGMVSFKSALSAADVEAIRQYVIRRANEDKALEQGGG